MAAILLKLPNFSSALERIPRHLVCTVGSADVYKVQSEKNVVIYSKMSFS